MPGRGQHVLAGGQVQGQVHGGDEALDGLAAAQVGVARRRGTRPAAPSRAGRRRPRTAAAPGCRRRCPCRTRRPARPPASCRRTTRPGSRRRTTSRRPAGAPRPTASRRAAPAAWPGPGSGPATRSASGRRAAPAGRASTGSGPATSANSAGDHDRGDDAGAGAAGTAPSYSSMTATRPNRIRSARGHSSRPPASIGRIIRPGENHHSDRCDRGHPDAHRGDGQDEGHPAVPGDELAPDLASHPGCHRAGKPGRTGEGPGNHDGANCIRTLSALARSQTDWRSGGQTR